MQGSANLNIMMKTARKAGRSLTKDFREVENLQGSSRSAGDFVLRAGVAAEKIIREELTGARATYGYLADAGGEVAGEDPTRRWLVEPLGGKSNFMHGLPHWAVSIALEHKRQIVSAVVYDPAKDELFFSEKGGGAWMNDTRIRVSDRRSMSEALFATGVPAGSRRGLPETLRDMGRLMPVSAGVRHWGSAALDLGYLAAGRHDGYWDRGVQIWEVAAGLLIAREAGALVEAIAPGADPLEDGSVLCANEPIFNQFVKVLRG